MVKVRLRRPSPAMVVALAALFVALSGTGTAATLLATRSADRAPLANVRFERAAAAALRSLPPSLSFKRGPSRGPRGPRGPQGPPGVAKVTTVLGPASPQCAYGAGGCQVARSDAVCPAGSLLVGGFIAGSIDNVTLFAAGTSSSTYSVIANNLYSQNSTIQAEALCAGGPG